MQLTSIPSVPLKKRVSLLIITSVQEAFYTQIFTPEILFSKILVELLCRWTYNDPLRAKYNDKMAAMNAPMSKPKGSRKLKDWESR